MQQIGMIFILSLLMTGFFEARADERSSSPSPQRATVQLLEYRFEPSQITFKAGQAVELTLINEGGMRHEFITEALKDLDVDIEINGVMAETHGVAEFEIRPKAKAVLRFTPEKPGEFPITCQAREPKDHLKEGMVGKLVIR